MDDRRTLCILKNQKVSQRISYGEVLQLLTLFERELLQDIFFLGLSFREAGEKRGISKSTCFRLYKKILNKIRKMLDERGIKFTFEDDDL